MSSQLLRNVFAIARTRTAALAMAASSGLSVAAGLAQFAQKQPEMTLVQHAHCMCRAPPNLSSCRASSDKGVETTEDKRTRMDELYRHGHLTDIYEQLNNDPETSSDASLLFQLARATYKLGLASPLPGRQKALNDEALLYAGKALQLTPEQKLKADVHALYAIILQKSGKRKEGSDKRKFYEAAQEHLTAALKEDRKNFLANFAFAEMNRDVAEASQMVVPASKFSLFYNEAKVEKDVETWKAVGRYAQKAVFADPTDVQSLNLLAKAKYELGDLPEAKKLTVRAVNASRSAKFADERKAAQETRLLMDKINEHFETQK